jgi:hypothetical protein
VEIAIIGHFDRFHISFYQMAGGSVAMTYCEYTITKQKIISLAGETQGPRLVLHSGINDYSTILEFPI